MIIRLKSHQIKRSSNRGFPADFCAASDTIV